MKLVANNEKPIKPRKVHYCPTCGSSAWSPVHIGMLGYPRPVKKLCCTYCLSKGNVVFDDKALNIRPMINKHTYKVQKVISESGKEKFHIRVQPSHIKSQDGELIEFNSESDALVYIEKLIAENK